MLNIMLMLNINNISEMHIQDIFYYVFMIIYTVVCYNDHGSNKCIIII